MDLRVQKTRNAIINAFLELRSTKPLEKITVRELSEKAVINKSTFYLHYTDVYNLSEKLETELIDSILASLPHPEYLISKPEQGIEDLYNSIISHYSMIRILFSGSRAPFLLECFEPKLKALICEKYPEYRNSSTFDIIMCLLVRGEFQIFLQYIEKMEPDELISIFGRVSKCIFSEFS